MKTKWILAAIIIFPTMAFARWQQEVAYQMDIVMDAKTHQFTGSQQLTYTNNSHDTLERVFYHLYFNAFQPGSMMDIRSQQISDPDRRVGKRIAKLTPEQQGYQKIITLTQDGKKLKYTIRGTVMEVELAKAILPNQSTVFDMEFEAQVPIQIRRSGRQNFEGIDYSMTQWYPKMAAYDKDGWHPDPYVGREFYGPWGSFDVRITIDSTYTIGGTGILQNPLEIGHGYCPNDLVKRRGDHRITWNFKAEKVHDFAWAADRDYKHITHQIKDGPLLHFFYQMKDSLTLAWEKLPKMAADGFEFLSKTYGKYPFAQYSIIQGGDGGMEYPMATLITGRRKIGSLFGVTMHEAAHSWYQMMLGSNEADHPWMDEGFTSYASNEAVKAVMPAARPDDPHSGCFQSYFSIVKSGLEEPMSTHGDHFNTNRAYGVSSYSKGELFLVQLRYIVGDKVFDKAMKTYFRKWSFKHPRPTDVIRIFEEESGMVLDWFYNYWVFSTKTIDYGIQKVEGNKKKTRITLQRTGKMPMPCEVEVTYENNKKEIFYIPMGLMKGEKEGKFTNKKPWDWVNPTYEFDIAKNVANIKKVSLKFKNQVADVNSDNDSVEIDHQFDFVFERG